MISIYALLLTFITFALAADQAPDVANALLRQYRPITTFKPCRSTNNVQANCGFCYGGSGTFLGWNCDCDRFVSALSVITHVQSADLK